MRLWFAQIIIHRLESVTDCRLAHLYWETRLGVAPVENAPHTHLTVGPTHI